MLGCNRSTPVVASATSAEPLRGSGYAFTLTLQDSLGLKNAMPPRLDIWPAAADTSAMRLFVGFFGARRLTDSTFQRLSNVALPIVAQVRDACAPRSVAAASCERLSLGRGRPCDR